MRLTNAQKTVLKAARQAQLEQRARERRAGEERREAQWQAGYGDWDGSVNNKDFDESEDAAGDSECSVDKVVEDSSEEGSQGPWRQ
jgi:hypothetical protein